MKQNKFLGYFTKRLKFSLRSVSTSQEMWHVFMSRGALLIVLLLLFLSTVALAFALVVYTPLMDYMPGYGGAKSKEKLVASLVKLDSLDSQLKVWKKYSQELRSVMDGKKLESQFLNSDTIKGKVVAEIAEKSSEDSLLRSSVEEQLAGGNAPRKKELSFAMISPVVGKVVSDFSAREGSMGVVIEPKPNSVVLSVMDGTVLYSDWTPADGYVVVVQHAASMVSVYKNLQQVLKTQGSRIKAGEGLGIAESVTSEQTPEFVFELWNEGNAVDPQSYITFELAD